MILVEVGDYAEAHHLFEELETTVREMGSQSFLAMLLGAKARLAMVLEDYTAAHCYLVEMQRLSEETNFQAGKINVLCY